MTAEEMFKELGYSKYLEKSEIVFAKQYGTIEEESIRICLNCYNEPLIIFKSPSDNYDSETCFYLTYALQKAINKQIEELGWDGINEA